MKIKIILVAIVVIGFILRFTMLGSIPAGLTSDEADTGYDAYSILITGRDQWGIPFPLTSFKGFGDNRSPLYTYLAVPAIKFFDLSSFAVRFPSALAGVLTILMMFLLSKRLFDEKTAVLSSVLVAVSPWAIGLSRQGIESNIGILLIISSFYLLIRGFNSKKALYLSSLLFVASVYAYTSYLVITPLLLAVFLYVYRKKFQKAKKRLVIFSLIFLLGIIPLFLFTSAGSRFSQVGLGQDVTSVGLIDVVNEKIGSCQEQLPGIICRVINNKALLFSSTFFQNYLRHFSFDFLFLKGTTTQFSLLPERGLLYMYEVIFLLVGIYVLIRKKNYLIVALLLCTVIPDALSGSGHHSRASAMLPFILIIEAVGLIYLLQLFQKNKHTKYIGIFIALFMLFSVISFSITYFTYFKKNYSSYSQYVYKELSVDLFTMKNKYPKIYVSNYLNDTPQYIFYLFYNKIDPRTNKLTTKVSENGFISVTSVANVYFDNFIANPSLPERYMRESKSLFIAHPDAFRKDVIVKKKYKDLTGGTNFEAVEYKGL